ncbi:xylulokinase [Carnimonas nigrificans]|uniref:xylulokinase n=1 Tax=Carnimonas nigrificans TaxID=64323 RepID=UPI0004719C6A|nr:xylulokinase [Carnimonas nigrificans]
MYVGVDCGTQSTKVVIMSADSLRIIGTASVAHSLDQADNGRREQQPSQWVSAFEEALAKALSDAGVSGQQIKGIGVSGQQHGMVALDADGKPVYPAKLWCDTESAAENAELLEQLGGPQGALDTLGVVLQTGYTASKIAWLRRHHRDAYDRIKTILLPHDYLNFYLTGERVTEAGDASGTGYFDTRQRQWSREAFALVAPELDSDEVLPRVIESHQPAGQLLPEVAERLGLSREVLVSSGGGDNMMAAIGTGAITPGLMTVSMGTSGTLFGYSDQPMVTQNGLAANFCSSSGGWLPLVCTMNLTSATTQMRTTLGMTLDEFNQAAASAEPGAGGITCLPFFNGERVPALPTATASFVGMSSFNMSSNNLARAVMEGTTFGLRYGLDALLPADQPAPQHIRLVGGGAKSALWRQMVSDIMNCELVCPQSPEAAALGAALQALWCHGQWAENSVTLETLCSQAVRLDESTRCVPQAEQSGRYRELYQRYLEVLHQHYPEVK